MRTELRHLGLCVLVAIGLTLVFLPAGAVAGEAVPDEVKDDLLDETVEEEEATPECACGEADCTVCGTPAEDDEGDQEDPEEPDGSYDPHDELP